MNVCEAQVLARVPKGLSGQRHQGNADQVALGKLRNAGYVTRETISRLRRKVRLSLNARARA